MQDSTLVLRDIHQAAAPSWWPPAPGWWVLAATVLVVMLAVLLLHRRKRARIRRVAAMFDDAVDTAGSAPAQIAAMSELLRRAARRRDPQADRLQGETWLALLNADDKRQPFTPDVGRLLLEGGFQRDADARQVAALKTVARERFIGWMSK